VVNIFNKIYLLLFVVGAAIYNIACSSDYLTEDELQKHISDESNGLSVKKEVNGFDVKATYRPTDLLVLQEAGGKLEIPESRYDELKKKYDPYYYFILSLSKDNKEALYASGGYGQFSELVQTLSFRMGQYTNATTSESDTIPVADYVFPRTYGMGASTNLMFVFDKTDTKGDEWFQFNLSEFGMGLGRQNFRFRIEELESAPHLKFKFKEEKQ